MPQCGNCGAAGAWGVRGERRVLPVILHLEAAEPPPPPAAKIRCKSFNCLSGISSSLADRKGYNVFLLGGWPKNRFGKDLKGDFNLKEKLVSKDTKNQLIFTGLQITKRSFLNSEKVSFSISIVG